MRHAALLLLLSSLSTAPTIAQDQFRMTLDAPILFGTGGSGTTPEPTIPLDVTLSTVPAWAPIGSAFSASIAATGGKPPYATPVVSGTNPPPFLPQQTAPGAWSVEGTWLSPGIYSFAYSVEDDEDATDTSVTRSIEVGSPLAVASGTLTHHAGKAFSFDAVSGGYSLGRSVDLPGIPSWLDYDSGTGRLSGVMPAADHTQIVNATDGFSTPATGSLVLDSVPAPEISVAGSTSGSVGTAMTITPSASNTIGASTWNLASGTLPTGLTGPNASTGVISGTPTTAGNSAVVLRVEDADGGVDTHDLAFTIAAPATTWTAAGNGVTGLSSLKYGNGRFYGVGTSQGMTSTNGTTWSFGPSQTGISFMDTAYGNNIYVAVAVNGSLSNTIFTSPDGLTYTPVSSPVTNLRNITYADGRFVAAGSNGIVTSTNGTAWTLLSSFGVEKIAYGNNRFVVTPYAVGTSVYSFTVTGTTPTMTGWTAIPTGSSVWWTSLTFGNGKFVLLATAGLATGDGTTFASHPLFGSGASWRAVTYADNKFVAVSSSNPNGAPANNRVAVSADGVNWTVKPAINSTSWWALAYGNGTWIAGSTAGTLMTTTNP